MKPSDNVIYYDNHVLVIDKPPGIATQPNLEVEAKAWVKHKFNKPGNVFLEPIHRLDRPVGGLVLFARTSKALSRLQGAMRRRDISKTYVALVEKLPKELSGTLRHFLIHDEFRARVGPEGKESILHYRVIGPNQLEIELETGRYHQIRAQLSAIGCPILGDSKYGSRTFYEPGIALIHAHLIFDHPVTGAQHSLRSEQRLKLHP